MMKIDHVALEVGDLDEHIRQLVQNCGLSLLRRGARSSTGQRIAMLGDGTGTKLELIEADVAAPAFAHLAFRVDDTAEHVDRLNEAGWSTKRPSHRLEAAKADTALLDAGHGLDVQVITYDDDSPDDVRWDDSNLTGTGDD